MLTYICFVVSDTESIYKKVFTTAVSKYGKKYTTDLQMKVMGSPETNSAHVLVTELNLPLTSEQFLVEFKSLAAKLTANANIMPGIMASYLILKIYIEVRNKHKHQQIK